MDLYQVTNTKSQLGEGPFWHDNTIYWTDILAKKIFRYFPKEEKFEERVIDDYVGAFAPSKNEGFVLATKNGFATIPEFNGVIKLIDNPEKDKHHNRFNDGKCDAMGRFWAGTMDMDATLGLGALYMLDTSYIVHKKFSPVTISNGICWSLDNKQMYYIDTPTQQVLVFDFDLATGNINNPKTLVSINKQEGAPDGMTIDTNGCLWIALWGGGVVVCYDPQAGRFINKIKLPVSQVSSCIFGGENLDELYITTAWAGLDETRLKIEPLAGALFKINVGIKGLPVNIFNG